MLSHCVQISPTRHALTLSHRVLSQWDWQFPFVDTFFVKGITHDLQYDAVHRQGLDNTLEKLSIRAARATEQFQTRYYTHGSLWWSQHHAAVGDNTWLSLDAQSQSVLQDAREEYAPPHKP